MNNNICDNGFNFGAGNRLANDIILQLLKQEKRIYQSGDYISKKIKDIYNQRN